MEGASSSAVASALGELRSGSDVSIRACEALEELGGYLEQLRRAGLAVQAVPDYSIDSFPTT
jgi:hypothetical protein